MMTAISIAILGTLLMSARNVLDGDEAGTYLNVSGLAIHYTSFLITAAVFLVVLTIAAVMRWVNNRH